MSISLSVIIPAHNPRTIYLGRVLDALRTQSLDRAQWQLIIVDNASKTQLAGIVDLSWHPCASIVREETLGLAYARMRGFDAADGEVVILVDDDNVLDPDYLAQVSRIAEAFPFVGTWSGDIRPEFEDADFRLPLDLSALLTLRQVASDIWSNDISHNASTPWGAGLCIRRGVIAAYRKEVAANLAKLNLDLKGNKLIYGGDTDITYAGCRAGYGKGVFASLRLTHLIPRERCTAEHLRKVAFGRGYSEVLHGYINTGIVNDPRGSAMRRAVRALRDMRKPALQKMVASAHARGAAEAVRELQRI